MKEITYRLRTHILYPWTIGESFKYKERKYRIVQILHEESYTYVNGMIKDIDLDTPMAFQWIDAIVVGELIFF
jgi:hypothetical protein